jgi:integrase
MASTYKLNRGGDLWRLRVRLPGGRDYYRHMRGSAEQADKALVLFHAELEAHGPSPLSPATRFSSAFAQWIERNAGGWSPATLAGYRDAYRLHLAPAIGDRPLNRIIAAHGLDMLQAMRRAKLAPATISRALRLGRAVLGDAVTLRALSADPWAALTAPVPSRPPRDVVEPAAFGELGARIGGELGDLVGLAIATGLRRGELLALRWRDIDLDAGRLDVSGALEYLGGTIRRKSPKTRQGARSVALPAASVRLLAGRREAALLALGSQFTPEIPVFPAADGRSWRNPDTASQYVRRALRAAGLPENLHGMRHAHATALLSAGINPRQVQQRLGHADIKTTLGVYGHVLPRDETRTVALLDSILTRREGDEP